MTDLPSQDWIQATDSGFSAARVAVRARPMKALMEWSKEHGSTALDSPEACVIFEWYTANYPTGSFSVGSLFTGAFFFDEAVWPIRVPIAYGKCSITIKSMVTSMTNLIGGRLDQDAESLTTLEVIGADCLDYAYGFDDLRNHPLASQLARDMLTSGHKELQGTVYVLLSEEPNEKVAQSASLATEMYLKSYLAHHAGLHENGAKKIGHDISESLQKCLAIDPSSDLRLLASKIGSLPEIGERYKPRSRSLAESWYAYSLAQSVGACVIRSMTDRDCRNRTVG